MPKTIPKTRPQASRRENHSFRSIPVLPDIYAHERQRGQEIDQIIKVQGQRQKVGENERDGESDDDARSPAT